ncbi:MAG: tetraacyldisaccharide 4'-kinase [Gammaproteobacteria bacterium]|nr:tetraacyldisaccharide 4'-kinase [Gammaproteobacteria bacterium]
MKRLDYYWYRKSPWLLLLWPLSALFCLLVLLRRGLFAGGLRRAYRMPVPVIVVGNITVGGSGKTPTVLWLADYLKQHGYRPGLISRGYGGQTERWPQSVTAQSEAGQVGDEAVLLARRSGCPMVVGPDRVAAAEQLLAKHPVDVIISDDGMQHYRLQRDIEIAVLDGERRLGNGHCLPAGPLREPPARLASVDFIVANGPARAGEWPLSLDGDEALSLSGDRRRALNDFAATPVHAVAAIGNPQRFFDFLRAKGLEVIGHDYPDHHPFAPGELDFTDPYSVLMTEKDAVKYLDHASERHWFVPVSASLPDEFGHRLLAALEKVNG